MSKLKKIVVRAAVGYVTYKVAKKVVGAQLRRKGISKKSAIWKVTQRTTYCGFFLAKGFREFLSDLRGKFKLNYDLEVSNYRMYESYTNACKILYTEGFNRGRVGEEDPEDFDFQEALSELMVIDLSMKP